MQSRAGPAAVFVELRQEGEESSSGRRDLAGESADFGAELLYAASGGTLRFFIDQCCGIGQFCGIAQFCVHRFPPARVRHCFDCTIASRARKRVVEGKRVEVSLAMGGRRTRKEKK